MYQLVNMMTQMVMLAMVGNVTRSVVAQAVLGQLEIPFTKSPQWLQDAWREENPDVRYRPKVYVYPKEKPEIHAPDNSSVVLYDANTGQMSRRYISGAEDIISAMPIEKELSAGRVIALGRGHYIAVVVARAYHGYIELYVHPDDYIAPKLIGPALTERQKKILATIRGYTSGYRREVLNKHKVTQRELDELQYMGLLDKRNAITLAGRNLVIDVEPWSGYYDQVTQAKPQLSGNGGGIPFDHFMRTGKYLYRGVEYTYAPHELRVDTDRGVLYLDNLVSGITVLRICRLPIDTRDDFSRKRTAELDLFTARPETGRTRHRDFRKTPVFLKMYGSKEEVLAGKFYFGHNRFDVVDESGEVLLEVTNVPDNIMKNLWFGEFADITVGFTGL